MPEQKQLSARRRIVTPTSMAEAGIALTVPNVSVESVAGHLGVSIVAIYNNIESAGALRTLVAEEILRRWTLESMQCSSGTPMHFFARRDLTLIPLTIDGKRRTAETDFEWSMRAVIMGTEIVIDHPRFDMY